MSKISSDIVVVNLLGEPHLAAMRELEDYDQRVMIAVPFTNFILGMVHSLFAISVFLTCGLAFLSVYVHRVAARESILDFSPTWRRTAVLYLKCLAGFATSCAASVIFTCMLTTLESASTTASVTKNKRESLVYEMENREALAQNVLKKQVDKSITQANALADILSEQPSLKDRASLIRLAKVVGADYLMLFDKSGNEVCASNTLTGLRVKRY